LNEELTTVTDPVEALVCNIVVLAGAALVTRSSDAVPGPALDRVMVKVKLLPCIAGEVMEEYEIAKSAAGPGG
jgi:hypothetical protein